MDGGSTLNFIQTQVAHKLGLPHLPSTPLKVIVGNGEELSSTQVCKGVQLEMQGHVFVIDFYALNLCGHDIVLGTPWLKTLGLVLMDYNSLKMNFTHNSALVEICGEIEPPAADISYNQLKKLIATEPMAQFFSLSTIHCKLASSSTDITAHANPLIASPWLTLVKNFVRALQRPLLTSENYMLSRLLLSVGANISWDTFLLFRQITRV
ncbi:hypothetical protein L195_g008878 [Trifolium pratense]|uniref:Retrotransposon-related protein n=1 Tax=Trifolium pratense TaxID=57577 RepID=A0A2K3PAD8_TRIPR|nr:hypothetical protein L195_g008878 [Trifolium pratense]